MIIPNKTTTFDKYSNDTSFTDRIVEMAERLEEQQEASTQFINLPYHKKEATIQDLRKELGFDTDLQ
ncbi:MAG: hypothetical protein ACRD9Q_03880 [Nitrososphaeraceae archaeon]